jgi:hypothetical protein
MKFAGWYGIIVGLLMLAQWGFFLATGQAPELQSAPFQIYFHLAGEFVTAIGLVVAGIGLLTRRSWAVTLYLIMAGMLLYSVIVSPGYFAQQGQWLLVGMFAILLILALASIVRLVQTKRP